MNILDDDDDNDHPTSRMAELRTSKSAPTSRRGSRSFLETRPPIPPILPSASFSSSPSLAQTDETASVAPSSGQRRGSLPGFLLRAASHEVPITQSTSSQTGRTKTMLRKQKPRDHEEPLRQQQRSFAQVPQVPQFPQVPKQAPQLPSPSPIPIIDGFFGGVPGIAATPERPDSVAMFSGKLSQYEKQPQHRQPPSPRPVNNFSRPGYMPHSISNSSLASAGSKATRLHSSPPTKINNFGSGAGARIEHDLYARTESMTNRGRESYAPQPLTADGHVMSPRRVRRRKDPTPFK